MGYFTRTGLSRTVAATGLAIAAFLTWATILSAQGTQALLYGVTPSNRLIAFSEAAPGQVLNNVAITNLAPGERIVGIDFRPVNNLLYGLGSGSQLYLINHVTGAAIRIGVPFTPALSGTEFGFDFNPAVDRIRIVSDTGQNLRLHPDTGVIAAVDGNLSYAPGDARAGEAPVVTAVAYTNPDNDAATGTTLYDIDSRLDSVSVQNPPNEGRLNTLVPLGIDAIRIGFDIGLFNFYASIQAAGATTSTLVRMSGPQRADLESSAAASRSQVSRCRSARRSRRRLNASMPSTPATS